MLYFNDVLCTKSFQESLITKSYYMFHIFIYFSSRSPENLKKRKSINKKTKKKSTYKVNRFFATYFLFFFGSIFSFRLKSNRKINSLSIIARLTST
jgi:hypothetical protein